MKQPTALQLAEALYATPETGAMPDDIQSAADELVRLHEASQAMLEELKNLRRAYVNLLESGRNRIVFLGGQCDALQTMVGNDPHLKSAEAAIAKGEQP